MIPTAGIFAPSLVGTSVKEEVVMVEGFIGSLNVATTLEVAETPVARSAGVVDTTVGGVVSGSTSNGKRPYLVSVAKWLPARSVTAVVIVAVYLVPAVKFEVGFSVAVCAMNYEYTTAGIFAPSLVGYQCERRGGDGRGVHWLTECSHNIRGSRNTCGSGGWGG